MRELPFSAKYDHAHALQYHAKHQKGVRRRLTNLGEHRLARRALALAGEPQRVLDLPSGAGRFWELLAEDPAREIIAADLSADMLAVGRAKQPADVVNRISRFLRTSAFAIDLPDDSVDCVFSMRLMHHIHDPADRLRILREFARVSTDSLILSTWVDGNYQAARRLRRQQQQDASGEYRNRDVFARSVLEGEYRDAGFEVSARLDLLPGLSMWRFYVLRKSGRHADTGPSAPGR